MILTVLAAGLQALTAVSREPRRSALRRVARELRDLDRPQAPVPASSR